MRAERPGQGGCGHRRRHGGGRPRKAQGPERPGGSTCSQSSRSTTRCRPSWPTWKKTRGSRSCSSRPRPEEAKRLAEKYPGFDVVVATATMADDPPKEAETLNGGKTLLVSVGQKGKYAGVVGLFKDDTKALLRLPAASCSATAYNGPAKPMKAIGDRGPVPPDPQGPGGRPQLPAARLRERCQVGFDVRRR